MILHKNYDNTNCGEIYVYSDHISFANYNRPLPPVSIKDLNEKTIFDIRVYLNPQIKDMFYKLHLIESYGSGVRRAKTALEENGNDAPVFLPDNETDDYTQVIMYINKEYKGYEDQDNHIKASASITLYNSTNLPKNQKIIFETIVENPGLRIPALSEICGLKEKSIANAILKLRKKNLIEYEGTSKKGGYFPKK